MLIAEAKLRKAVGLLVEYCLDMSAEHRDMAIILSQRLHKIDEETIKGTVSTSETCQVYNTIASGMLSLLRDLDELHPGGAAA